MTNETLFLVLTLLVLLLALLRFVLHSRPQTNRVQELEKRLEEVERRLEEFLTFS